LKQTHQEKYEKLRAKEIMKMSENEYEHLDLDSFADYCWEKTN